MALLDYLDHSCTIQNKTITVVAGVEQKTYVDVYAGIPCHFYHKKITWYQELYWDRSWFDEQQQERITALIQPEKTLVTKWMRFVLSDPDLSNWWVYKIQSVRMNRMSGNTNDSIELELIFEKDA